jgi:hypothetical protein
MTNFFTWTRRWTSAPKYEHLSLGVVERDFGVVGQKRRLDMAERSSSSSSPASSPREPATEGSDRPTSPLKKSSASLLDEGTIQKMLEEGKAFTRQFVCELPPLAVKQPVGEPTVYDTDAEDKLVSCKSISTYPLFPDGRYATKSFPFVSLHNAFSSLRALSLAALDLSVFGVYIFPFSIDK